MPMHVPRREMRHGGAPCSRLLFAQKPWILPFSLHKAPKLRSPGRPGPAGGCARSRLHAVQSIRARVAASGITSGVYASRSGGVETAAARAGLQPVEKSVKELCRGGRCRAAGKSARPSAARPQRPHQESSPRTRFRVAGQSMSSNAGWVRWGKIPKWMADHGAYVHQGWQPFSLNKWPTALYARPSWHGRA